METEALFKNSWICLLIVCSYWLSHYWRRALISGCAVCRGSKRRRGYCYNTERLFSLFSGSLCLTLPLDTGIKVSWQLRGHFLTDAQQPLWGETGCVSLTFGNSLKGSWRFSYFSRCHASHVCLRLQVKTIILELCVMRMSVRKWLFSLGISTCRCAVLKIKASLYVEMSSYVKHFLRLTHFSFDTGVPDKKKTQITIYFHCLKGKQSSFE